MERRTLLAIALSFLVLYGYQTYFAPRPPASTQQGGDATKAAPGASAVQPGAEAPPATAPATSAIEPPSPEPAGAAPLISEGSAREITIETTTVQAVFSNRGGRVTHWRLKTYLDDAGKPVDLVPSSVPVGQPSPFQLRVDDEAITNRINNALYKANGDANGLTFEFQDAAGLHVRKEFRFEPGGYIVAFSASVTNADQTLNPTVLWGPGLGDIGATQAGGSFFTGNAVQAPQAIYDLDTKVTRTAASKLSEQPQHEGQFRFVGIDDHYFLAAAISPGQVRAEFQPLALPSTVEGSQRQLITQTFRFAQPPQNVKFFVGPKQFDVLRAIDVEMVKAINFGMFAFLVLPLLSALKWIYAYVGNYGGSIILLTILINLVIFPLRHKSVVSMRKMQALQPQLKAIQDRYKDLKVTDPAKQKMNTEVMNLYREKGVNPASGCVPMLLTMPVLFAFYSLLSQSIELRGAPFAGWIHDLSQHDPYYITPLLMGASMFWQQKITPTTADPAQAKMMMIMPVVFTGMFLQFPSGLAIYYFVSNLWTIGQQYFTNWWIGPMTAPRPPAERKLKNVGSGKTPGADRT